MWYVYRNVFVSDKNVELFNQGTGMFYFAQIKIMISYYPVFTNKT